MSWLERIGICTCCPRHILAQLAQRRSVRALAVLTLAAGVAMDLHTFGVI